MYINILYIYIYIYYIYKLYCYIYICIFISHFLIAKVFKDNYFIKLLKTFTTIDQKAVIIRSTRRKK